MLGATGLVGEMLLTVLEERKFPVQELFPLASERSLGKSVAVQRTQMCACMDAATFDFKRAQIGLYSAGGDVSAVCMRRRPRQPAAWSSTTPRSSVTRRIFRWWSPK